jgi:uncharacterized protein (UPF0548 family)
MGLFRTTTPEQLAGAPFTYAEVGGTRRTPLPAGYTHTERHAAVGVGRASWERAVEALFDWRAQRGAALRVRASGPASTPGTVVLLTAGLPWLGFDIPCRVVWSLTQGPQRGFAYGTLPGHPVSGEESFIVGLGPDDDVVLTVRAFSRPATTASRVSGPVGRAVQSLALDRYAAAIRRAAHDEAAAG